MLKAEMRKYYSTMLSPNENEDYCKVSAKIESDAERFESENKGISSVLMKSKIHELVAEHFEPVIFKNSPFFFEMGVRPAKIGAFWAHVAQWSGLLLNWFRFKGWME